MSEKPQFSVFSGTNSLYLTEKICQELGIPMGKMQIQHFSDGEFCVRYEESIRGHNVYLVNSTNPSSEKCSYVFTSTFKRIGTDGGSSES